MKSIVRRDSGDDWRDYVRKLYEEETGQSDPDDETGKLIDALHSTILIASSNPFRVAD